MRKEFKNAKAKHGLNKKIGIRARDQKRKRERRRGEEEEEEEEEKKKRRE